MLIPIPRKFFSCFNVDILPQVLAQITSSTARWICKESEVALRENQSIPKPDSIESGENVEPEAVALVVVQDGGPELMLQIRYLVQLLVFVKFGRDEVVISDGSRISNLSRLLALLLLEGASCLGIWASISGASSTSTSLTYTTSCASPAFLCMTMSRERTRFAILSVSSILRVIHEREHAKNLVWVFGIDCIEKLFEIERLPDQE